MLMGAFFAIMAADKLDSWWLGLLVGIASGGVAALIHAFFAIHLQADQIVSGTAVNFLAVGRHRLPVHRHLRQRGNADRHREHPQRPSRLHRRHSVLRPDLRPAQPDDLDRDRARAADLGDHVQDSDRPADPGVRRAPASRRHGRDQRVRGPVRGGRHVRNARGRRRGAYPLDRLRQLVQREHDRGARLHRARGAHLRQLAPVRAGRRLSSVRLLERARSAPARILGVRRDPVHGAAVRPHADRGRRRDRALDPAGGRRTPLQKQ